MSRLPDLLPSLPPQLRALLDLHPAELAREIRLRDMAYGCYLYFGVMLGAAFVLNVLPTDTWLYLGLSSALGPGVLFGFLPAGLAGLVTSWRLRREWPPVVLGVLTLGGPLALWAAARFAWFGDRWGIAYFAVLTACALWLPLRWFLILRRQLRTSAGS